MSFQRKFSACACQKIITKPISFLVHMHEKLLMPFKKFANQECFQKFYASQLRKNSQLSMIIIYYEFEYVLKLRMFIPVGPGFNWIKHLKYMLQNFKDHKTNNSAGLVFEFMKGLYTTNLRSGHNKWKIPWKCSLRWDNCEQKRG